jgi:hypothetical protein
MCTHPVEEENFDSKKNYTREEFIIASNKKEKFKYVYNLNLCLRKYIKIDENTTQIILCFGILKNN